MNNVVTWYVYDGNAILSAYDLSGAVTARYAHGLNIDEPLAVQQGSTKSFYHADGLGSIVALTNAAGSVVQTYSYDSFGNITPSGGINQPYTYTAREYDNETGLYYYRARYYDPKAGRFITKDPISFAGGDVNLYAYVKNNPVNRIDPTGLFPEVDLNNPFQPKRETLDEFAKVLKEYYKKKTRRELVNKCVEYAEKKALTGVASKLLGISGVIGDILFPDDLNEGENETLNFYRGNK